MLDNDHIGWTVILKHFLKKKTTLKKSFIVLQFVLRVRKYTSDTH
jgi:hypothetical protein